MNQFETYRNQYPNFIYKQYHLIEEENNLKIIYDFEIENLKEFHPSLTIPKEIITTNVNQDFLKELVFHLGLVELVSYFKCTCSKNVIIQAGYLNKDQIAFFKKLYYLGLGEFLYTNHIEIAEQDLMNVIIDHPISKIPKIDYKGNGNLIPVGGGKDSCVTLELLKNMDNTCFAINPKEANLACIEQSGKKAIYVKRTIDKNLIELNKQGFLNGHTPFSAIVAFTSYIVSYLSGKKYIVLSNEGSANESTVLGTKINHQYSKTYEFEQDFNHYVKTYFQIDIHYFSFLRPLSEFQIGMIFSSLKSYHKIFKSCNVGSKNENWNWCCKCPKCLFVYMILRPFLTKQEMLAIFHEDLYENKELLNTFQELLGYAKTKPFECVGTYKEARYAVSTSIQKETNLPYLLTYYKEHYPLEFDFDTNEYNPQNNLPEEFEQVLRKELEKYVQKNH